MKFIKLKGKSAKSIISATLIVLIAFSSISAFATTTLWRNSYTINNYEYEWNGKYNSIFYNHMQSVMTRWNISIANTSSRSITAQLKEVLVLIPDTTKASLALVGASTWTTTNIWPLYDSTYYAVIQTPDAASVTGFTSLDIQ